MNLNHVSMPASDMEASIAFYTRLGCRLIVRSKRYARFACSTGNSTFSLAFAPESGKGRQVVVYFECDDLIARVYELQRRGAPVIEALTEQPWNWWEGKVEDPAGNMICLFSKGQQRRRAAPGT